MRRNQQLVLSLLVGGLVAILAALLHRGDAFWCGARGIPLGTFWRTPGFERLPELRGRVVLVTGANSGLGLEVARRLLLANASVIVACRHDSDATADALRAEAARSGVAASPAVRAVRLDLNDLRQVGAVARALRDEPGAELHALVNNAGVASQFPLALTDDGVERTFQANYLGHFALTTALLPLLERSARVSGAPSRVVHLTSGAHRGAPAEGVPLSLEGVNDAAIGAYARYGMAKLACLSFSNELARRFGGTRRDGPGLSGADGGAGAAGGGGGGGGGDQAPSSPLLVSVAVHPGVVATRMLRRDNFEAMLGGAWVGGVAWRLAQLRNALFAYAPQTAALTVLRAVAGPEEGVSGQLLVPVATPWPPRHPMATDAAFGAALWQFSEQLVSRAGFTVRRSN